MILKLNSRAQKMAELNVSKKKYYSTAWKYAKSTFRYS